MFADGGRLRGVFWSLFRYFDRVICTASSSFVFFWPVLEDFGGGGGCGIICRIFRGTSKFSFKKLQVKLWEVYGKRSIVRTYAGHKMSVKDVTFNNDGTEFLSASFDRFIKLWDTETGLFFVPNYA